MFGKTEVPKKSLHHTVLSIDLFGVPEFIAKYASDRHILLLTSGAGNQKL